MPSTQFISQQFGLPDFIADSLASCMEEDYAHLLATTFEKWSEPQYVVEEAEFEPIVRGLMDAIITAFKPSSAAAFMALLLHFYDTCGMNAVLCQRTSLRASIWGCLERNVTEEGLKTMPEVSYLQSTFESGKEWLVRSKNV